MLEALDEARLVPGDIRLVAWTDVTVPGMEVKPEPSQTVSRTLVVAHIQYGPLEGPQSDVNSLADIVEYKDARFLSEESTSAEAPQTLDVFDQF